MKTRIYSACGGFSPRRRPSQIHIVASRRTAEIKSKFAEFGNVWICLTDEQRERWKKWITGQTHYKNAHSAFIGLNMVAQSVGMPAPCSNPPPQDQLLPAKPRGLWLSYAYGRVVAGCDIGKLGNVMSARLRLWFSSSTGSRIHRQIVAIADVTSGQSPTMFVESISIGRALGSPSIPLADIKYTIIKAQVDLVIAVAPDTAPLVSEPSEISEVRIYN